MQDAFYLSAIFAQTCNPASCDAGHGPILFLCYVDSMLRGLSQRTAVALALMGVLLISAGTCVLPAQQATHRCCQHMHMSMPCVPSNASCCTASPQTPPALVTPAFAGHDAVVIVQGFVSAGQRLISRTDNVVAAPPEQSPPLGIFNLRI